MSFIHTDLGHYGIYKQPVPGTAAFTYSLNQAKNLTSSLMAQPQFGKTLFAFLPSCYKHTVIESNNWGNLQISGYSLLNVTSMWMANNGFLPRNEIKSLFDGCMQP